MNFSDISTTSLPLSLWKVHSPRFSLSLKYSSSPSFPGNYCLSFQPEPQEIPSSSESSWLSQQPALAMSPCGLLYFSMALITTASHWLLLWLCLTPVSPSRLSTPGRQWRPLRSPAAGKVSDRRPQQPRSSASTMAGGQGRTRPPSFPWAVSSHWPMSARKAGHSCQVWDSSDRWLQGFPVHSAKTFSEMGCSLRLATQTPSFPLLQQLIGRLSPTLFSLFSSPSLSSLVLRTWRTRADTGSNFCFFPKAWNKVWCTTGTQLLCVKWIHALRTGEDQPKVCGWVSMDWTHSLGKWHQEYTLKNWY